MNAKDLRARQRRHLEPQTNLSIIFADWRAACRLWFLEPHLNGAPCL